MIIDKDGMQKIEESTGLSDEVMMQMAAKAIADYLQTRIPEKQRILFLVGKGNNGGDASLCAMLLREKYSIKVMLCDGEPKTPGAAAAFRAIPDDLKTKDLDADVFVDGVYGYRFAGSLTPAMRSLFQKINKMQKPLYSIDINSGAECDTGIYDPDALRSTVTMAIDCHKPFHMLRKDHHLFREKVLLPLFPHENSTGYPEMDEEAFFAAYPKKKEDDYKGTHGSTLLIGGSYSMAGALGLNIIGAQTVGSSYIEAALPDEIYPILANRFLSVVYHPFSEEDAMDTIYGAMPKAHAIAFGSGAVYMPYKDTILDIVLQNAKYPVVLDAEALRLLQHNTYILRFVKCPVIITPHIGEFAALLNKSADEVRKNRLIYAKEFAVRYHLTIVCKGPETIVVSPAGEVYINQTGNAALAQAGSGDLLTGMITGMLTQVSDVNTAVRMAVWLHGRLADEGIKNHSQHTFQLEWYPEIMDQYCLRKEG